MINKDKNKRSFSNRVRKWVGLGPVQIVAALFLYWALIFFFVMLEVELAEDAMNDDEIGFALFVMLPLIVLFGSALIRSVWRK